MLAKMRRPSLRLILWLVLIGQIGIGLAMVEQDIREAVTGLTRDDSSPYVLDPVAPGDQTRRYRPNTTPTRPDAPRGPTRHQAPPDQDMTFEVSQIDGIGTVLLLTGQIVPGSSDSFQLALDEAADVVAVALHSPGGIVREALRIGTLVRAAGLNSIIVPEAACLSACPLILFSGVERRVSRRAWIGMHQAYYSDVSFLTGSEAAYSIQALQAEVLAHIDEMGVDPVVLSHAMATPPEEVYFLVEEELIRYNVATELVD